MPPTPTDPGVYIVEAPSGVHSITGVATSESPPSSPKPPRGQSTNQSNA